jgi:predicted DNA-binding protein (MmcQ/YjbR family)
MMRVKGDRMPKRDPLAQALEVLRTSALAYPEATEDHPWGETAIKVKGKVFIFLSRHDGGLNLSMKLPVSNAAALEMPFAQPTGYGLGKHGWITSRFEVGDVIPIDLLREWLDESFRAVAPKTVLARLESAETNSPGLPGVVRRPGANPGLNEPH